MTVERGEPTQAEELTEAEIKALALDRGRWCRMGRGAQLDEWLRFGSSLIALRRVAMARAGTNRPGGSKYAKAFGKLLQDHGLHTMPKGDRTAVLWLHDGPDRLEALSALRAAMTSGQRARLNSPISARQSVQKRLANLTRDTDEPKADGRFSPTAKLQRLLEEKNRQLAEKDREIAALKIATKQSQCDAAAPQGSSGNGKLPAESAVGDKGAQVIGWRVVRETAADRERLAKMVAKVGEIHREEVHNRHIRNLDPLEVPAGDRAEYIALHDKAFVNKTMAQFLKMQLPEHVDETLLAVGNQGELAEALRCELGERGNS
jgi:hypothetical protein